MAVIQEKAINSMISQLHQHPPGISLSSSVNKYILNQIEVCWSIPATEQLLPTKSGEILLNNVCSVPPRGPGELQPQR